MPRPQKFKIEVVLEAIKNTGGIKTEVSKKLNCSCRTIYDYIERYPEVKAAFEEEEEKVLDMAEGALFALIQNGDTSAIFYYLNNKGRKRGYGYQREKLPEPTDTAKEERVTGVLETPGVLSEEAWEKAAK